MMKIALAGLGRTGKIVAEYLLENGSLDAVFCRDENPYAGRDLGDVLQRAPTGVRVSPLGELADRFAAVAPDVLIDFSGPDFLRDHLATLEARGVHVVTAVTDFTDLDVEKFKRVGARGGIGLLLAPNITYGVNVLLLMARLAAKLMGEDYDFEVVEEHHNRKRDIPSGTAKKIAQRLDKVFARCFSEQKKVVPVHSIRSGGIIGKHKLIIAGKYDRIEIAHESISREAFAAGAYQAACFIRDKRGFYEIESVFAERLRPQASPGATEEMPAV